MHPLSQDHERLAVLHRIFRVLGLPSAATWPELEHLPHWRQNTEDVRAQKPEHPPAPRLPEHLAEHWCGLAWWASDTV